MEENTKIEGIVVKSFAFQDHKRVITIFTPQGLISLMTTVSEKNPGSLLTSTPLSMGEFVFNNSKGNIKKLVDSTLYYSYLQFSRSFSLLESASLCLKGLTLSQFDSKPSSSLYELTKLYLAKIPHVKDPLKLTASFYLKLLKHEGLFSLESYCHYCNEKLSQGFFDKLPCCSCLKHDKKILFSDIEWQIIKVLVLATQFSLLESIECEESLSRKVIGLFESFFTES